jgi:hypothetical protein
MTKPETRRNMMDRRLLLLAMGAAAMAGGTSQVQAQAPVESFATEGVIGGQSYRGTVAVQQTGDTYALLWRTGNEEIRGVGILRNNLLITGFVAANNVGGFAYYQRGQDGTWEGEWALVGGTEVGRERWTPGGGSK